MGYNLTGPLVRHQNIPNRVIPGKLRIVAKDHHTSKLLSWMSKLSLCVPGTLEVGLQEAQVS